MSVHRYIILLWFCILIDVTTCCMKSGGGGGGGATTTQKPTTTTAAGHKLPCRTDEIRTANCLNGGTCYVVMIRNIRTPLCSCTPQWQGRHCERRYHDPDMFASTERSTGATVGIVFGVLAAGCVIILAIVFIYMRWFRQQNENETESLPKTTTMSNNAGYEPDCQIPTISENVSETSQHPQFKYTNGYHNMTNSSDNALSGHQIETAI